jgi:non-ribosomal peptide synthetase component F
VDLQPVIGFFVNMLALRNFPGEEKTFREFLLEVKEKTIKAYDNQDYQFEDLVDNLLSVRESSRHSLIDTVFVFQNAEMPVSEIPVLEIPGLKFLPYKSPVSFSPFDLILHGFEADEKIILSFQYKTTLFKEETINMYIRNFKEVVSSVLENKFFQLKEIDISDELLTVKSNILDEEQGEFDFLEE